MSERHYEMVAAKKYYGSHVTGWVLLVNGYPRYHATGPTAKRDVEEFMQQTQSTEQHHEKD